MITIVDYDSTKTYPGFAHLELGAANYGPEMVQKYPRKYSYRPSQMQHLLLMKVAVYVLSQRKNNLSCVLYLNDIDAEGLHKAAVELQFCLTENKKLCKLDDVDITIVKLVADMTTFRAWPRLDSAHLLNPHLGVSCRELFSSFQNPPTPVSPRGPMMSIVKRVARASRSGIYVSDINETKRFLSSMRRVKATKPEVFKRCLETHGLLCLPEKIDYLSEYYFPNGDKLLNEVFSFRIVQSCSKIS